MHLDEMKLSRIINRLEELYNKVISSAFDSNIDKEALNEYRESKKELLLYLFDKPIQITDSKHFAEVRKRLQRLTLNGDPFLPDKSFDDEKFNKALNMFKDLLEPEFSSEEIDDLAWKYFYDFFSGQDYVLHKMKSQLLFLQTERLPENFKAFITEIQECFIFQKYIAATVLCRTVLEIAIRDLFKQNKLSSEKSRYWPEIEPFFQKKREENKSFFIEDFDPTLNERMNIMSLVEKFSPYTKEMHEVRTLGNSIVHGNRISNRETCSEMIKKTFLLIHHLYEVN